jgi:hypothetical protein
VLYRCATELGADFRLHGFVVVALYALELDLDEFMGCQRTVDFLQHRFGKAFAGDGDDRMKRMGGGAQSVALFRC